MGGFGSRGGVFLMAPVKRRGASDTPPVWVTKSGYSQPCHVPGADPPFSLRCEDYFEKLDGGDPDWRDGSKSRSTP